MLVAILLAPSYQVASDLEELTSTARAPHQLAERLSRLGYRVVELTADARLHDRLQATADEVGDASTLLVSFSGYVTWSEAEGPVLVLEEGLHQTMPVKALRAFCTANADSALVVVDGLPVLSTDRSAGQLAHGLGRTIAQGVPGDPGRVGALVALRKNGAVADALPHVLDRVFMELAADTRAATGEDLFLGVEARKTFLGWLDRIAYYPAAVETQLTVPPGARAPLTPPPPLASQQASAPAPSIDVDVVVDDAGAASASTDEPPRPSNDDWLDDLPTQLRNAIPKREPAADADAEDDRPTTAPMVVSEAPEPATHRRPPTTQLRTGSAAGSRPAAPPRTSAARQEEPSDSPESGAQERDRRRTDPQARSQPQTDRVDVEALCERGDLLFSNRRMSEALEEYRQALAFSGPRGPQRAEIYRRMGDASQVLGKGRQALAFFEHALEADPLNRGALVGATSILVRTGEYQRIADWQRARLAALPTAKERREVLEAMVSLWADHAQDVYRALAAVERLLQEFPDDPDGLQRLYKLQHQAGDHEAAIVSRQRLAAALRHKPRRRARVLVGAARAVCEHLRDADLAVDLAEQAMVTDPTAKDALEIAATLLAHLRAWPQLADTYEALLEQWDDDAWALDLARKLAAVCMDKLHDPDRARRAIDLGLAIDARASDLRLRAARIAPTPEDGLEHALAALDVIPTLPGDDTLALVGQLQADAGRPRGVERVALLRHWLRGDDVAPPTPARGPDALDPAARARALGAGDDALDQLLRLLAPAALERWQAEAGDPVSERSRARVAPDDLQQETRRIAACLGVKAPAVILDGRESVVPTLVPSRRPVVVLGAEALTLPPPSRRFLVATCLARLVDDGILVDVAAAPTDIRRLVLAARNIGATDDAPAPSVGADAVALVAELRGRVDTATRKELRKVVAALPPTEDLDVEGWLVTRRLATLRLGLLATGDVPTALTVVRRHPLPGVDAERQLATVVAFALNPVML